VTDDPPLFQEELFQEPFWMLAACQLVNRASWARARGVLDEVRRRWPGQTYLALADLWELTDAVRPLGFQRQRAINLVSMAQAWANCPDESRGRVDVLRLPGCGRYAADSWEIFVLGRRDVEVTDKRLRQFLDRGV